MKHENWKDIPTAARAGLISAAVVQVVLLGIAHADLSRRSDSEVRGPKPAWRALTLVSFIGPIAYFALGRLPR